jgi:hypothetical protein
VGVFVFKFDQATQATAVTEGFPLGNVELIKRVLRPKLWTKRIGHKAKPPVWRVEGLSEQQPSTCGMKRWLA